MDCLEEAFVRRKESERIIISHAKPLVLSALSHETFPCLNYHIYQDMAYRNDLSMRLSGLEFYVRGMNSSFSNDDVKRALGCLIKKGEVTEELKTGLRDYEEYYFKIYKLKV